MKISPILWQTGRGSSLYAHNGPRATRTLREFHAHLQLEGISPTFHNDSRARALISRHCPYALQAYDCLRPPSYRADLWRYCALYTFGGWFLDAEDLPLVPLPSLHRTCDTLLLVRDQCPGPDDSTATMPCKVLAVQISFMAAVPRHPFFACCLAMAVRNIEQHVHGRNDLDLTGPVLAGACLRKLHAETNYSMTLTLAADPSRNSWQPRKALYLEDGSTIALRLHAWDARHASNGTRANGYVDYARAWTKQGAFRKECQPARRRAPAAAATRIVANGTTVTSARHASRAAFERLSEAVEREGLRAATDDAWRRSEFVD